MSYLLANVISKRVVKNLNNPLFLNSVAAFHGRSRIGNRDVVGYGINGSYNYIDRVDYPMPAIRFQEYDDKFRSLREKEKGDWKKLTLEEKKALYRFSFCLTFAEQRGPKGDWKYMIGGVCAMLGAAMWAFYLVHVFVYPEPPATFNPAHQSKMLERMIQLRVDPIDGLTSKYDYENNRWKD